MFECVYVSLNAFDKITSAQRINCIDVVVECSDEDTIRCDDDEDDIVIFSLVKC